MRKSVTAFIFGLIGGIFCLGWGFFGGVISDIGASASEDSSWVITQVLGWLEFLGAIGAIVGACQCFKRARIGGIILACSTAACCGLNIYTFTDLTRVGMGIGTAIILILLPIIFLIVATVCAFLAKDVEEPVVNPYGTYSTTSNVNAAPKKTMEEELTELKSMYEKQLMSEEEYNQAKKGIIQKYTNK